MAEPSPPTVPWHGDVTCYPRLYDLLHLAESADIKLYLDMTQHSQEVLECGIGTGRVAIPMARAGRFVHGVDNSREMLAHLDHKLESESEEVRSRIRIYEQDLQSFELGLRFPFVYVPFMTFNYLADVEAQLACLNSIREHLETGGSVVIESMSFCQEWFYSDGIPRLVARRKDPETGLDIEVFRITRFDPSTQIVEHDRYYRFVDDSGKVLEERRVRWRNRFFFLGEARLLVERAGLRLEEIWGDHKKRPYTRDSRVMLLVASR